MVGLHGELGEFIVGGCVSQLGLGLSFGSLTLVMAERSDRTRTGIATGLVSTMRNVGGSTAGAAFSALLSAITITHTDIPGEKAFVVVWLVCALAAVATGFIVATAGGRAEARSAGAPRRTTSEDGAATEAV
jgi:MFS family permease